jgi:hypothetical protein
LLVQDASIAMMFFVWRRRFGAVPPAVGHVVRQACDQPEEVTCLVCPVENHIDERHIRLDCWTYYV